jgi:hypothetical protein
MKMRAKTWCMLFGSICVLAVAFIIAVNYFLDAYGYFSALHYGQSGYQTAAVLKAKIRHIRENPDLYTGFIVGGSRTGVLDPALASEYTGLPFYNLCFPHGDQALYEDVINFLVENTPVKHIILQLTGLEIVDRSMNASKNYALELSMSSLASELKTILLADCSRSLLNFMTKRQVFAPKTQKNGMIEYIEAYSPAERANFGFVEKNVLPSFQNNYGNIFIDKSENNFPFSEFVLNSLARIKRKCLLNDVKLVIVAAPTAVETLAAAESPVYHGFLQSVSEIADFYNFNGFSKYNFNPYNFVDTGHYRREVGDKMLNIIFNQEPPSDDDWGVLLTPDTIDEYLDRRKEAYTVLKTRHEESGVMILGAITDDSFIP